MATYHVEYDGYYNMKWHDDEPNALKRWFDNYKIDRHALFAAETEWLVVKGHVCEIGDDGRGTKREVIMDHTAPPAPMLTFAAKRRWEPPPPKTAKQLREEAEWARMTAMGYVQRRVARYKPISLASFLTAGSAMATMNETEYDVEWVPRPQMRSYHYGPMTFGPAPQPKQHRRNA